MKKKLLFITPILILLCFTAISQATLLETTITGMVDATGTIAETVWNDGDSFVLKVIYDDSGTIMHEWTDGSNMVAEFGGGDDGINDTFTISSGWSFYDDALFILDAKTQLYKSLISDAGGKSFDTLNENLAFELTSTYRQYYLLADGLTLYFIDHFGNSPEGGAYAFTGDDYMIPVNVEFDTQLASPIPEPATMLLLVTGLVGVAGASRRKKKNQA